MDFATSTAYIAIGDLDGDGKSDIAAVNSSTNTVSLFRNTSTWGVINSGSFAAKVDFVTGWFPMSVVIGDLDGDGKPELISANSYNGAGGNSVSVLRNTSSSGIINASSFAANVEFATGKSPYSVAIGDIDGDGKPDICTGNNGAYSVSVLRNTSSSGVINAGSFAAHVDFNTGTSPFSIAISDIDGDGKPDLAEAGYGSFSSRVSVLRNLIGTISTMTSASSASVCSEQQIYINNI